MRANSHSRLIIDQDSDRLGKLFDHNGGLLRLSLRRIQLAAVDEAAGERSQKGNPNDLKLGDHKMTLHCSAGHNIFRAALKKMDFLGSLVLMCFVIARSAQRPKQLKQSWWRLSHFPMHFAFFWAPAVAIRLWHCGEGKHFLNKTTRMPRHQVAPVAIVPAEAGDCFARGLHVDKWMLHWDF